MRPTGAKEQRVPWQLAMLGLLSLAPACSPPAATSSIEGRVCTNWGAQACSLEAGNPRAECWGSNWQIAEYCGERGCNTAQIGGQTVAYCGDTPPAGPDAVSGWDALKTDTAPSDTNSADTAPGDSAGPSEAKCWGWTCPLDQACSGVGTCESPGCLPPCSAGQTCQGGATPLCVDRCEGACFDSQWCAPSGNSGMCTAMPCKTPVFTEIYVADSLKLLDGAAAASHCPKLANSAGGLLGLSKVLGDLDKASAAAAQNGQQTYALAALADGGWGWISARRTSGTPCTSSACQITASKWATLQPDGNGGGTCAPRNRTDPGSGASSDQSTGTNWELSLRNNLYRFTFLLSKLQVELNAGRTQAWLCGAVTPSALQVALSSSHSSNGLAIPSTAELLKLAPFDIDSDGDGSADAWSIALELSLQPGQLKGWLP